MITFLLLAGIDVSASTNSPTVPRYEVFELTLRHEAEYEDPFFDVTVRLTLTSPGGRVVEVGGFHYGSDAPPEIEVHRDDRGRPRVTYRIAHPNLWKARFAPDEAGEWRYAWSFRTRGGEEAAGDGAFRCVEGRRPAHGFVRHDPDNAFRWVFDDGTPYYPIGLQDGVFDNEGTGSVLATAALEGPFRMDRQGRPTLPAGAMFQPGPSNNPVNADVYFRRYGRCGFNLLRFSQNNFSLDLYDDLDHWRTWEAAMVDEYLRCARRHGFRVMYGFFGYQPVFGDHPDDAEGMEKVRRFVRYSIDRWGAYADFWEFLNEQNADDRWYAAMIPVVRECDPYRHPIATSWERPRIDGIDINAPHWYEREDEHRSDSTTAGRAREWREAGKPVIVGEQGNFVDRNAETDPRVGGVWDPRSALRMRIRCWTAFFHEIAFVFWNTSYAKDGHNMNLWIGPREREYVRALQDFSYALGGGLRTVDVRTSAPGDVRAYGLASSAAAGVYLHHFEDHETPVRGVRVTLDVPAAGRAYWYSPETAAILGVADVGPGPQDLEVPEFVVDVALLVRADGSPDIDGDGRSNDVDPDEDDDGDGVGDDANGNGTPDCEEMDLDGDGVPRSRAVPWDEFPWDAAEWRDTDGDGRGDNGDADDDGDGWSDEEERAAGTDPLDPLRFP